jgi:hypothetical protein
MYWFIFLLLNFCLLFFARSTALRIEALFELFLVSSRLLGRDETKKASADSLTQQLIFCFFFKTKNQLLGTPKIFETFFIKK